MNIKDHQETEEFLCQSISNFLTEFRNCLIQLPQTVMTRVIIRDTALYAMFLERFRQPKYMSDSLASSFEYFELAQYEVDSLKSSLLHFDLLASELSQIERLDFPIFYRSPYSLDAVDGQDQIIKNAFSETGTAYVTRQVESIRNNLAATEGSQFSVCIHAIQAVGRRERTNAKKHDSHASQRENLLKKSNSTPKFIKKIHNHIIENVHYQNDRPTWTSLVTSSTGDAQEIRNLDRSFYDGCGGILYFLSLFKNRNIDTHYVDFDKSNLKSLIAALYEDICLSECARQNFADYNIGLGLTGLGGQYFAGGEAAKALGRSQSFSSYTKLILDFANRQAESQNDSDIIAGKAGLLFAYTSYLNERLSQKNVDDEEIDMADKLYFSVKQAVDRAISNNNIEIGFGHGLPGALATLESFSKKNTRALSNNQYYKSTSEFSIQFENLIKDISNNISDARWCNGLAGTLSGALAFSKFSIDSRIKLRDIIYKLTQSVSSSDFICCGRYGVAMVLRAAYRKFKDDDIISLGFRRSPFLDSIDSKIFDKGQFSGKLGVIDVRGDLGNFQGALGIAVSEIDRISPICRSPLFLEE